MELTYLSLNKIQAVILQLTPFCNIDCRYCYLPDRTVTRRMTSAVLSRIVEAVFSSSLLAEQVTLLWHAGEPLMAPLALYRETLALVERFNTQGVKVIPTIQTNALGMTQQWCDFIKQHHIRVGVSLDGPQHIHDAHRVDRAGRGTFERAMRGIQLLQQNDIEPSVIMVLTDYALNYPDEIWHFFCEHHLNRIAFNVEEMNGAHTWSSLARNQEIKEKYRRFLQRLLELREQSATPPFVREIDTFLGRVYHLNTMVRSQENSPGTLVSFDSTGNVATFASDLLTMAHPDYGDFLLGNIFDGTLEELLSGPKLHAMNQEIQQGVLRCRQTCAYFGFCGGGSPANKFSEHGTLDATETLSCQLKIQATLDVILKYLEQRS